MKILITPTSLQPDSPMKAMDVLRQFTRDLVFNPTGKPLTENLLIPLLKDCDGYIAGLDEITGKVLDSCPNLKVISRYGSGYDCVDLKAAHSRGITVTNTPSVNAEAVGELAFGLVLSLARNIPFLNQQTRDGNWPRFTGMELAGKHMGIIGLGAIGKVVARCAQGFSMHVCAYDPFLDSEYAEKNHIRACSLEELISSADVISLHLPLTPSTKYMINQEAIAKMKDGVIIINTSRGGIIDEVSIYEALVSGKVGGLGLDAFEVEPPVNSPLLRLKNVISTPHTGAHTREAKEHMADLAVRNLIDVLTGKECRYIIKS